MSNRHTTIVIKTPKDPAKQEQVRTAFAALEPHLTAMSLEDEMTVQEMIEQHPAFEEYIAVEAREKTAALHNRISR